MLSLSKVYGDSTLLVINGTCISLNSANTLLALSRPYNVLLILKHLLFFMMQGVVGSLTSGKSALVHRYLTGSYMQEESPEGWYIISQH